MPIVTDITKLSQTPELNGPDGSVDPPSTLDDQDRYLGSFIAKLRDGVGFSAGGAVAALGFTPVQQGGGAGQLTNKIKIGWTAGARLALTVDTSDFPAWPMDADAALKLRSGATVAGTPMVFTWSDPGGTPAYLWGGDGPASQRVVTPAVLSVAYSANAGNAYGCSGNAATASNANAVNGISGWSYSNQNYNPPYLWATAGSGSSQFLVQPGNLSVNYANSANTCNRATNANYADSAGSVGYADNAGHLGGQTIDYYINNGGSICRNLTNNALANLNCLVGGTNVWWGVNISDARLKKDIKATTQDSLAQIEKIEFVSYRFRDDLGFDVDDGRFHPIGLVAQQVEKFAPEFIDGESGSYKQPRDYDLLMTALHAIQQMADQIRVLTAKLHTLNGGT